LHFDLDFSKNIPILIYYWGVSEIICGSLLRMAVGLIFSEYLQKIHTMSRIKIIHIMDTGTNMGKSRKKE
jgi:hypothetical protein